MIEKILWWMILATMVLPIVVWSNALSPFHFGKVISFRIIVEFMLVLWVALLVGNARYRPRWTPLTIAVTAVTASFALSTLFAEDQRYAWWGTIERMGGLYTFLHYWVYYLILVSVVRTREQWERLLKVSVWVGVLSAFYGIAQWLDIKSFLGIKIVGFQRNDPIGTAGNAAMFAGYLLFTLFWAAYFFLRNIRKWQYAFAFLVMAFALVLANTRAPIGGFFIGAVVAAGFYAFSRWEEVRPRLRTAALTFFVVAIVGMGFVFAVRGSSLLDGIPVLEQVDSIRISNATVQTRIWTWHSVWEGIKERPFLGWGPDNIIIPFNEHFNPLHFKGFGSETWFDRAHNLFFDLMTTQGIVGFTVNVGLFALVFREIRRVGRRSDDPLLMALFTGLVTAYLVHLFMFFDVFITYFVFFLFVAFIDSHVKSKKAQSVENGLNAEHKAQTYSAPARSVPRWAQGFIVIVMVMAVSWMIWTWNIEVAKADYKHTRALLARHASIEETMRLFDDVIVADKAPGRMEARQKLAEFAVEVTNTGALRDRQTPVSDEDQFRLNMLAERHLRTGVELHPANAQQVIFLGRVLNSLAGSFGQKEKVDEAIAVLRRGVELSPTRQRMVFELAQALVIDDRFEEAFQLLDDSVQANPEIGVAYWYRGILRSQLDDVTGALEDVENAKQFGYDVYDDYRDMLRLVNIYLEIEEHEVIADLYERIVELAPNNPQFWASLAATYVELGRYDDARRAALRAADVAPAFAPAVQEFINSLPE